METWSWSYIVDASNCVLWIGYHANMEDGTQKNLSLHVLRRMDNV